MKSIEVDNQSLLHKAEPAPVSSPSIRMLWPYLEWFASCAAVCSFRTGEFAGWLAHVSPLSELGRNQSPCSTHHTARVAFHVSWTIFLSYINYWSRSLMPYRPCGPSKPSIMYHCDIDIVDQVSYNWSNVVFHQDIVFSFVWNWLSRMRKMTWKDGPAVDASLVGSSWGHDGTTVLRHEIRLKKWNVVWGWQ